MTKTAHSVRFVLFSKNFYGTQIGQHWYILKKSGPGSKNRLLNQNGHFLYFCRYYQNLSASNYPIEAIKCKNHQRCLSQQLFINQLRKIANNNSSSIIYTLNNLVDCRCPKFTSQISNEYILCVCF